MEANNVGDLIHLNDDDDESDKQMDAFVKQRFYQDKNQLESFSAADEDELSSKKLTNEKKVINQDPSCFLPSENFIEASDIDVEALDKGQIAELLLEEMECPICLIEMTPPKKIFACTNAHLFCQNCKIPALTTCPKCREDFLINPPLRSKLAERWACKIYQM